MYILLILPIVFIFLILHIILRLEAKRWEKFNDEKAVAHYMREEFERRIDEENKKNKEQ